MLTPALKGKDRVREKHEKLGTIGPSDRFGDGLWRTSRHDDARTSNVRRFLQRKRDQ